jgi:LysM repeat protein
LNIVVSATTVLAVLWWWERARTPVAPTAIPLPVLTQVAELPTGTPGPVPVTPFPSPPPPTQPVHTVQAGETLGTIAQLYNVSIEEVMRANNLADPNILDVGQRLIIPVGGVVVSPTATPPPGEVPTPLSTSTRDPNAPLPKLEIREVASPGVLTLEAVTIVNTGGPVDLAGWTLRDESGRRYTFPALTLFEGGAVNVHTQVGQDTVIDLYWGLTEPIWSSSKVVLLNDQAGSLVAKYTVP